MATRFRVDQEVRVKDGRGTGLGGSRGKVVSVPSRGDRYYGVVIGGNNPPFTFLADDLEAVETTSTPKVYVPTPEHLADIKAISDRLQSEAEEREWCEDYNEVIEDLNQSLTVKLELLEQDYTVKISGEDTGYYGSDTEQVEVRATSEEEAVAKVAEIVDKYLRGLLVEKS